MAPIAAARPRQVEQAPAPELSERDKARVALAAGSSLVWIIVGGASVVMALGFLSMVVAAMNQGGVGGGVIFGLLAAAVVLGLGYFACRLIIAMIAVASSVLDIADTAEESRAVAKAVARRLDEQQRQPAAV